MFSIPVGQFTSPAPPHFESSSLPFVLKMSEVRNLPTSLSSGVFCLFGFLLDTQGASRSRLFLVLSFATSLSLHIEPHGSLLTLQPPEAALVKRTNRCLFWLHNRGSS